MHEGECRCMNSLRCMVSLKVIILQEQKKHQQNLFVDCVIGEGNGWIEDVY